MQYIYQSPQQKIAHKDEEGRLFRLRDFLELIGDNSMPCKLETYFEQDNLIF